MAAFLILALLTPDAERDAQRLVGLLEYVAGDYRRAVRDGRVVSEAEYREQVAFLRDARDLAASLPVPADTLGRIDALASGVRARAADAEVSPACRSLRDDLLRALRLSAAPPRAPDPGRGEALYAVACGACHGASGQGAPPALALDPTPLPLSDLRAAGLTPYRAFNAITFGRDGTSMPSFDVLPEADRWALAFHVLALAAPAGADPGRGGRALAAAGMAAPTIAELALRGDPDLSAWLSRSLPAAEVPHALAWLRARGPAEAAADPVAAARRLVRDAVAAAGAGDRRGAARLAQDAYLVGFEPAETALGARDPALVAGIEQAFLDLRAAARDGAVPSEVGRRAARVEALLDDAAAVLAGGGAGAAVAFWAALLILWREGIEAVLLIAALLAVVRRAGRADLAGRVHAGWLAALAAGGLTWAASGRLIDLSRGRGEAVEGVVALLAAAVLFYVSYWLLSKIDARRWMAFLGERVQRAAGRGGALALGGMAFLAAYREAFETVLFLRALLLDHGGAAAAVAAGAAAGAALLAACAVLILRGSARLPLPAFFGGSGALLCLLSVVFAGQGLAELRAAGWIEPVPLGALRLEWLGLYPDAVGLAVQACLLLALGAAALVSLRQRGSARASASAAAPRGVEART